MIKRQYTLYLKNRPGAVARLARILAVADVNIEGISVAESDDAALVQIIVDREPAAAEALKKAGLLNEAQEVSVVVLPHKPGVLAELAAALAEDNVHINFMYATAADDDSQCCIVISATDLQKVEKIVRRLQKA